MTYVIIDVYVTADLSSEFHLTSTLSSSLFAGTTCGYGLAIFKGIDVYSRQIFYWITSCRVNYAMPRSIPGAA